MGGSKIELELHILLRLMPDNIFDFFSSIRCNSSTSFFRPRFISHSNFIPTAAEVICNGSLFQGFAPSIYI